MRSGDLGWGRWRTCAAGTVAALLALGPSARADEAGAGRTGAGAAGAGGATRVSPPGRPDPGAYEAAAERRRDELIADLQRMIPRARGTEKADLLFQLAEYWWEKARHRSLREGQELDEAWARWSALKAARGEDAAGPRPRISSKDSDALRAKALAVYRTVLRQFPAYPRRDEVLFVSAAVLAEASDQAAAMRNYQELVREYPESKLLPDALVQMGEQSLARNDLAGARAAFQRAADLHLPKISIFALYKLAWCDYNGGDDEAAIARFERVIEYAKEQARASAAQRDRIDLAGEALKDVVLPFARQDHIDDAIAYLEAQAGPGAPEAVERLGKAYVEAGKFEQALRVYRRLQQRAPLHVRAPAWQQQILLALDKLERRDEVVAETSRLVTDFGPDSAWAKANASGKAALAEARELGEGALRQLAQDYHQEAIRTHSEATWRIARDLYRRYLDAYADGEGANDVRFYLAEVLYELHDWDGAAAQYDRVARSEPRGKLAVRAARDQILALDKLLAGQRAPAAEAQAAPAKAQAEASQEPLPAAEARLVAACDLQLAVEAKPKDEVALRAKAALLLYDRRHYAEASARLAEIIRRFPSDPWAQKAADLSMSILEARREWPALSALALTYRADRKLAPAGGEFAARLEQIAENARFYAVLDLYEKGHDPAAAAREFRAFVEAYPRGKNAAVALNNEIVIAEKAEQLDLVVEAAHRLLREHPGAPDELLQPALLSLAQACTRSGRFAEAAAARQDFAERWPSDARAPDQLAAAALWKEALGDDDAAVALWQRHLQRYGSRPEAVRVSFALGRLLERKGRWPAAAAHWAGFLRAHGSAAPRGQVLIARVRHALAARAAHPGDKAAAAELADAGKQFAALPEAERGADVREAAAEARFAGVEDQFQRFLALRLAGRREAELVRELRLKNAAMAGLLQSCTEVIRAGSPTWSEAALTRLGEAYRDFNRALLDAPMPRGLDAEQQELYRGALEQQAMPLEDKAVEAFRKAVETGEKVGVYGAWTLRAQDQLAALQPEAVVERHAQAAVWAEPRLGGGGTR